MFKMSLKGVMARKVRLGLTALAIVLGVGFVSGSFVFTDTLNATFKDLFEDVTAGFDVVVEGEAAFGATGGRIPDDLLEDVEAVEGVDFAFPSVEGWAQPIDKDGDAIGGQGPPNLGFSWSEEAEGLSPVRIKPGNGRAPAGPGEVVIDAATMDNNDFVVGDRIRIQLVGGTEEFEIVGIASFGDSDNLLGATLSMFDLETAQRVFDSEGELSSITVVAEPGVSPEELTERIGAILPEGVEAITADQDADEAQEDFTEGLRFFNILLLVFAGIALLVGSFIIYNTFSIIVAQRIREMAMLRSVGATGAQVTRLLVGEALVVGIVASAVGVVFGIVLAVGSKAGLNALGVGFPEGPLTVLPRTVIVGIAVGMAVTLTAALIPARKAARVPPIAAMRDVELDGPRTLTRRLLYGTAVALIGLVVLLLGLFVEIDPAIAYVGAGAFVLFLGVAVLAPLAVRGFTRVAAAPLRIRYGVTGTLARENAMRRPRRTAATASALMIGVALVTLFAVFGASLKGSIEEQIIENFPADYQLQGPAFADPATTGLSPDLARRLVELPEVEVASPFRFGIWREAGSTRDRQLFGVDPGTVGRVFNIDIVDGNVAALAGGGMLIGDEYRDSRDLGVGDTVGVEFPLTGIETVEVVGIFAGEGLTNQIISLESFEERYPLQLDTMVLVKATEGVLAAESRAAIEAVVVDFPSADLSDHAEFIEKQQQNVDVLLAVFTGLLALAIIIALLGIANTLALSIYERTREIGLLRAVGMLRRQVRRMIRWEAVIMAVFGGVLGLVVGSFLGWAVVAALSEEGLRMTYPAGQLVVYLVAAGVGGVVASIVPSFRGSRVDVLEAIAYE